MTTKVLLRSSVLLGVLLLVLHTTTFATAAVPQNDDLVFEHDVQTPLIERHRQHSIFHRIKRGLFDFFGASEDEQTSDAPPETTAEPEDQETEQTEDPGTGQSEDQFGVPVYDDGQQQAADYDEENYVDTNSSPNRKPRESGEDPGVTEHPNSIGRGVGDDEDDLEGSGEVDPADGSGQKGDDEKPFITIDPPRTEPEQTATHRTVYGNPMSGPIPEARKYSYRVSMIISEPYRPSLEDRDSNRFRELSSQITQAIDEFYFVTLPYLQIRSRVLRFVQAPDPVSTQVSFDLESNSPAGRKVRSVLADQLELYSLGNLKVRPDGFSFRDSQGSEVREECNAETEFSCQSDGKCLSFDARCDGVYDCEDETDEANCSPIEVETTPIPEVTEDPNNDVEEFTPEPFGPDDRTNEDDIPISTPTVDTAVRCRGDQTIRCRDGSRCFGDIQRCDGERDCDDGSDEEDCPPTECDAGEFACDGSRCIAEDQKCNFFKDCDDGTDELDCPRPPACSTDEFTCQNGQCISKGQVCDQVNDCYDASDEARCHERCSGDEFRCRDGTCLSGSSRCNSIQECSGGEDEEQCACPVGKWACSNSVCIDEKFVCDQHKDCLDGSDEIGCPEPQPTEPPTRPTCEYDEFECSDGTCIPRTARCDRVYDCRDNGDEIGCPQGCIRGEFQCRNRNCVGEKRQCDGYDDCGDNSDEENCVPTCPVGEQCAQELNLKTYPDDQVIKEKPASEDREVVIQCRDEGPLRAKVHWAREDGAPLPPGSSDVKGRLEMPNVQVKDSGNYVCEATGVSRNTPGRRVIAHLLVEKEDGPATRGPPVPCKYDEATCSNGDCIPKSRVCDGRYDCTDGTDEARCSQLHCEPNQFRCANKECVSKVWRCDGDKDCVDGSDEENCEAPPPGSQCAYNEYPCASNGQCILKSFHCDKERDCFDGSDEFGCTKVQILAPPPRMVILNVGETFTITCTALGTPIPEISWRLNWGHIPEKCTTTSYNGTGTLTCPSIAVEDQGAYSCEGINTLGWEFAVPDTILKVESTPTPCPRGKFNSLARTAEECISCFCFGVATECASADLFTYQLPAPFDQYNVISVETYPEIRIQSEVSGNAPEIRPVGRNGVQVSDRYGDSGNSNDALYFALPESYHGSQLKSYGGYLKYTVRHSGRGRPNDAPAVILSGNNYVLIHKGEAISADYETERSVRFFFGDWVKQQGWDEVIASREEIMMALAHVDNILIKVKYDDGPIDTTITNVFMDTADVRNTDQGAATFVEECRCPVGYTGLSCEHCASGYQRRDNGPWLGQCYREEEPDVCPAGYYNDPSSRGSCQLCPCPLTNPSNQFARTCHVDTDGQPTCDCPQGYLGRRCEQCAPGYEGNPLVAGDSCVKVEECDPNGSYSPHVDPATGVCKCKAFTTGRTCNKCKANTFHLSESNKFGCVSCFCMGVTKRCTSSNWYRSEIHVAFTSSIRDFSLVESKSTDPSPIVDGIRLNTIDREIVYDAFPNRGNNDVYYWQLPSNFLGDQLASYGGNLKYTVRYVPSPGGGRSRNNAADVELISANDINLRHYSRKQLEPNTAETFSVPLLEDHWQRDDGTTADREHLLMALADVQAIRIKATYTTHTEEAALSTISLETAVNTNTGRSRALEVEQCSCPAGYRGLSCEDCDVGYTRAPGLYLGRCVPCNCNGHSTQCDPETGICENCRDHTTGDTCELCEHGYEGDALRGTPQDCKPRRGTQDNLPCDCDPAGSLGTSCYNGQCECRTNVEGLKCNRCRPSTFGLSSNNLDGCSDCFCSGVTNQCHESSLYVNQIPTLIYDSSHGFTLTDSYRRDVITEGFDLNTGTNEIGYRYPDSRSQRLFWSLPTFLAGNQVRSYGGKLHITQRISTRAGAENDEDQDVVLVGNGITLYWTNPEQIRAGIPLKYTVPLVESAWTRLTPEEGLRSASRADLMTVLASLEAILVRATHSKAMTATYISDVSLDTAVDQVVNNNRARQVEACRCPSGYTGTSCETCTHGYYRDVNDKSRSVLGACKACPCNGNEQECKLGRSGAVKCYCSPGFTGQYCSEYDIPTTTEKVQTDPPPLRITVNISETPIMIRQIGNRVEYHCTGKSEDSNTIRIKWTKEGDELPRGRSLDDGRGILIITDIKVSDSGVYVCQVSDGINFNSRSATLIVEESKLTPPRVVIEPRSANVKEGSPVKFRCTASGNPQPQLSWIRVEGEMNPAAVFENGTWSLSSVRKSDEAQYKCIARNSAATQEILTILYVASTTPPLQPPIIDPLNWVGGPTETIRLVCTATRNARITWSRSGNEPMPSSAVDRDGILTIYDASTSDSGYYVCTSISVEGDRTSSTARVTIEAIPSGQPPVVRVEPERQEVSQGTEAEVKCIATGNPVPAVTWTKLGGPLGAHMQTAGNTLRIINPQVSDRGIYVCHASNSAGEAQSSAIIDVNRREPPVIEVYPQQTQDVPVDGSALLQCRVNAGVPTPVLSWAREDGQPLGSHIEVLPGGVLRFNRVTPEDGGAFVCSASNVAGSVSLIAILHITTPPVITITPYQRGPVSLKLGERVKLTCSATGHPEPTVSWTRHTGSSVPLSVPASRSMLPVAVYEISSVSYADEGTYTCHATNAHGPVEERIQIRVEDGGPGGPVWPTDPPRIPDQPDQEEPVTQDSMRAPDGGKVEMRCQVYGSGREAIYLDWKRKDGRSLPERSTVQGGVLLIPSVTRADAGEYVCQGINDAGIQLFTAITLLEITSPPRIELDPIQQVVRPGDSPRVTCRVTGDQPIEIEWQAIDRPLPYSVSHRDGVLQFNGITSDDAGKYVCKATNDAGTAEAVAQVLVNEYEQPIIPSNERVINTFVGSSVRLDCPVDSRARVNWRREGGNVPRTANRFGNVLELTEVRSEDSGRYVCQATNENGASSSNYIDLRVQQPAAVRIRASQELVNIGDTIDLQCDAPGTRDPRFRWTKVNEPSLPRNAQDHGTVLRISNVGVSDSGTYQCTAVTQEGTFENDYELFVHGGNNDAPAVETKSAEYGSGVVTTCQADIEPPIKFSWHKLGGLLPENSRASDNRLELFEVKAEDAGTYICTASNGRVSIEIPQVIVVTGIVRNFHQAPESYLSFAPIPDATFQFNIEVSFKPESYDGVILYNGQFSNGEGDFLLLSLVGGYPEFRFDLGSTLAVIRGQKPITLGKWHTIKLQRDRKEGSMLVDGEGPYKGSAGGRFQTLDLTEPLYIGGVPDYNSISRQANINSGFVGCISKVVIDGNLLDLAGGQLSSVGVTTCETCAENPCSNNGVCQEAATDNGYSCLCPAGYSGKLCANIGQACYPDACGKGMCIDREDGFVCSCPLGTGGSRCEIAVNVDEPAFHDRAAYLAYEAPKPFGRKPGKRYPPKKTGSNFEPRVPPLRKNRTRQHQNFNLHNNNNIHHHNNRKTYHTKH